MGIGEISEDGFLDGRVRVRQPVRGFRSGLDAVMLAAAVPARSGDAVLELGSGAGVASLCLAARVPDCTITGAEIDPDLVSLASDNAAANEMVSRVQFIGSDVLELPRELRVAFDHVLCNPPFHHREGQTSSNSSRAQALQDAGNLSRWLQSGVKRTAPNGTLTLILRADRLKAAVAALPEHGVTVFPLWPRCDQPAKRVIVQLRCGSRAPFALLPGLVLHEADGRYTPEAGAILRDMNKLPLAESK